MKSPKICKITVKQYGIEITKPWSQEMYDHNDKVAEQMKDAIFVALSNRYNEDCEDAVREIAAEVTGMRYGSGYTLDGIYEEACAELDRVQNYWLHESYPNLVKKGHCPALSEGFVGY